MYNEEKQKKPPFCPRANQERNAAIHPYHLIHPNVPTNSTLFYRRNLAPKRVVPLLRVIWMLSPSPAVHSVPAESC